MFIDGQKVTALIDVGAQVSSINSGFCDLLALEVHPTGKTVRTVRYRRLCNSVSGLCRG